MNSVNIPEEYKDLFTKRSFAYLATIMPDGSPQVTPLWFDFDGYYILINSAKGRQKDRNMRRDGRVALAIADPEDPYRYIQIRGSVSEITSEEADKHIDDLSIKYTGKIYQNRLPGQQRVIYKIAIQHISVH